MKIQSVTYNNRKTAFQVRGSKKSMLLPYSKVDPQPSADDPIAKLYVDRELGREGFTYVLASGKEGTVHSEQVLEYNQDPNYLARIIHDDASRNGGVAWRDGRAEPQGREADLKQSVDRPSGESASLHTMDPVRRLVAAANPSLQ
ncbi:MAG: hypothetical protein AB7G48_09445 [Nitrospiraceae bacterium]